MTALPSWAALAAAQPLVGPGDRIVFLGDSITQQGLYTAHVEDWMTLRYPRQFQEFWNCGWDGDTVEAALKRFDRDVRPLQPTIVTVCYGMNDGGYALPDTKRTAAFTHNLLTLIERIRGCGAQVVLLTPGCSDDRQQPHFAAVHYNLRGLRILADAVLRIAKKAACPAVDIHRLMNIVQRRGQLTQPAFTLAPDGNHPNHLGHTVMASGLLIALGERPAQADILPWDGTSDAIKTSRHTLPRSDHRERINPLLPPFAQFAPCRIVSDVPVKQRGFHQPDGRVYIPASTKKSAVSKHYTIDGSASLGFSSGSGAESILRLNRASRAAWTLAWRDIGLQGQWGFDGGDTLPCANDALLHGKALTTQAARLRSQCPAPCITFTPIQLPLIQAIHHQDFIHTWVTCGPFYSHPITDELQSWGGEAATACSTTPLTEPCWIPLMVRPQTESNCLAQRFGHLEQCFVYLAVDMWSPAIQDITIGLGSDDGFALWLNGELIEQNHTLMRGARPDSNIFPAQLTSGSNRLLLKISQKSSGWGFYLRISGHKKNIDCKIPLNYSASQKILRHVLNHQHAAAG